ncbi:MAG: acetoin utilization protein AcuB [Paraglaciecola sp.]
MKAKNIMSQYPTTLNPADTIGLAADIFLAKKYHALPIVKEEKLLKMVTVHDLLAYAFGKAIECTNDENLD